MKTDVSPMFLTYYMVRWDEVKQSESDQKCTLCGEPLKMTEAFTDQNGTEYAGYVCHEDKQVTWLKAESP